MSKEQKYLKCHKLLEFFFHFKIMILKKEHTHLKLEYLSKSL